MIKFTKEEKTIGDGLYQRFIALKTNDPRVPLITFSRLYRLLSAEETRLLKKVIAVDPKAYGKKRAFCYGIKPVPRRMVTLAGQRYHSAVHDRVIRIKTQYVPGSVFPAYERMRKAMNKELGRTINVVSGYRSPAYQAVILFIILREKDWDLQKTLRRVTLPGYSEHGHPPSQALDLGPVRGVAKLEDFDQTEEFRWLERNAARFGFMMPYTKGNRLGVMYEPWHWRYVG